MTLGETFMFAFGIAVAGAVVALCHEFGAPDWVRYVLGTLFMAVPLSIVIVAHQRDKEEEGNGR